MQKTHHVRTSSEWHAVHHKKKLKNVNKREIRKEKSDQNLRKGKL